MSSNRREFLQSASAVLATAALAGTAPRTARAATKIKAIAFDGFPIFDPRPVFARAETVFPGHGNELANLWRTKIFEYTWLRTAAEQYRDFLGVIEEALVFAAKSLHLDLTADKRAALVNGFLQLQAWPDVKPALMRLKAAGIRLAYLNNFTPAMLETNTRNAGLEGFFEHSLSVDAVRLYKPHPRTYQMGIDALGLKREEILFAAFAGWDVAGAKLFGYPTFWLNRAKQPVEELGVEPDGVGPGMDDLVRFALG
ncbi:MAG TPA: haloacid dehalogenase type II [Ferrovibrio sp.]|jgi:2-haloacid dehalogenase|uniref:haloacid dehalogenase type II n=1 Tax=Ferrovibrio sp. TaxID=1917215 RepID=UPI002ED13E0F